MSVIVNLILGTLNNLPRYFLVNRFHLLNCKNLFPKNVSHFEMLILNFHGTNFLPSCVSARRITVEPVLMICMMATMGMQRGQIKTHLMLKRHSLICNYKIFRRIYARSAFGQCSIVFSTAEFDGSDRFGTAMRSQSKCPSKGKHQFTPTAGNAQL